MPQIPWRFAWDAAEAPSKALSPPRCKPPIVLEFNCDLALLACRKAMVQTSTEQHARTRKTTPSPSFPPQNATGRGALPCLLSRLFICSCILRVHESAASRPRFFCTAALTYRIAFNRRAAKPPLHAHTREDAASFMARSKAELQAIRARQRREPKVPLRSDEEIETERREREAERDAWHWIPMEFAASSAKVRPPNRRTPTSRARCRSVCPPPNQQKR
jgi:hypothetical protein